MQHPLQWGWGTSGAAVLIPSTKGAQLGYGAALSDKGCVRQAECFSMDPKSYSQVLASLQPELVCLQGRRKFLGNLDADRGL